MEAQCLNHVLSAHILWSTLCTCALYQVTPVKRGRRATKERMEWESKEAQAPQVLQVRLLSCSSFNICLTKYISSFIPLPLIFYYLFLVSFLVKASKFFFIQNFVKIGRYTWVGIVCFHEIPHCPQFEMLTPCWLASRAAGKCTVS